jgi:hypothetical protein
VEDPQGNTDPTRVQYLALSLVGMVTLLGHFLTTLRIPTIPETFLAVLAVSQGTYVAAKAVKSAPAKEGVDP